MVLQRGQLVPVWGTDIPGTIVSVTLAEQTISAKADAKGFWRVDLKPTEADGKPLKMTVKGSSEVYFDDVLMGDVWFASGQSNMTFTLKSETHAAEEIPSANFPQIRFLNVPRKASRSPFRPLVKWAPVTPEFAPNISAVAYYFARDLHQDLKVPIGIISAGWPGIRIEAWVPRRALESAPTLRKVLDEWEMKVENNLDVVKKAAAEMSEYWRQADEAKKNGTTPPTKPAAVIGPDDPGTPGIQFTSMTEPFIPFALRGVLWYQGESNGWSPAAQYLQLFTMLTTEWRKAWAQPHLPFVFVQLPNFEAGNPSGATWADLRGAQQEACVKIADTAMAVAIDLGKTNDIHPPNKRDVGLRLALAARGKVYGEKIDWQAPTLKQALRKDGAIHLILDHAEGLVTRDNAAPNCFEVAGADGNFRPVRAHIENDTVIISPGTLAVTQVRYAWRNDPQPPPNLYNRAGLPLAPFKAPVTKY